MKHRNRDRKEEQSFRAFLLFPLLLFLAAWFMDKQLFWWPFPDYFLRTASFVSYEHKDDLQEQLRQYLLLPKRKKVVVMFGNSRTTTFDNHYIDSKYPDWTLFNFSVPGGTSDYYLYRLLEFERLHIRPDFVFFALSPQGMNATPSIAMDEVMLEGLPTSFIVNFFYNYKAEHLTNFIAKKLFWTYQYRPKPGVILARLQNHSKQARDFRNFLAVERAQLLRERGSVYGGLSAKPPQDKDFLRKSAEGTWRDFLTPFTVDAGQIDFTERLLATAERMKIPNAMLWVKVGPNLRYFMKTRNISRTGEAPRTLKEFFRPLLRRWSEKYHSAVLDMNYEKGIDCDLFFDSSHMAAYCFPEFTDYLFTNMQSILKGPSKESSH